MATALSYVLGAGPPDQPLRDAATAGQLATADGREQQARRLLALPAGRQRLVRVVREWFGIDGIADIAKDTTVYPAFAGVRASMDAESTGFIDEVISNGTGTVAELLGADWTIADGPLAALYGVASAGTGRTSLAAVGRRGLLNQGAFLSVFAHASETAPVLRGVALMRRVACLPLKSPTELNIIVTPPVPDPTQDDAPALRHSRDRPAVPILSRHHRRLRLRVRGVRRHGAGAQHRQRAAGRQHDGGADRHGLRRQLRRQQRAGDRAGRQRHRAHLRRAPDLPRLGRAQRRQRRPAPRTRSSTGWQSLPADAQGNLIETLVAFVRSDQFVERSGAMKRRHVRPEPRSATRRSFLRPSARASARSPSISCSRIRWRARRARRCRCAS